MWTHRHHQHPECSHTLRQRYQLKRPFPRPNPQTSTAIEGKIHARPNHSTHGPSNVHRNSKSTLIFPKKHHVANFTTISFLRRQSTRRNSIIKPQKSQCAIALFIQGNRPHKVKCNLELLDTFLNYCLPALFIPKQLRLFHQAKVKLPEIAANHLTSVAYIINCPWQTSTVFRDCPYITSHVFQIHALCRSNFIPISFV